jgi:hypothetical protein
MSLRERVVSILSAVDDINAIHPFYRISACYEDAEVYYNKIIEDEEVEDYYFLTVL